MGDGCMLWGETEGRKHGELSACFGALRGVGSLRVARSCAPVKSGSAPVTEVLHLGRFSNVALPESAWMSMTCTTVPKSARMSVTPVVVPESARTYGWTTFCSVQIGLFCREHDETVGPLALEVPACQQQAPCISPATHQTAAASLSQLRHKDGRDRSLRDPPLKAILGPTHSPGMKQPSHQVSPCTGL